MELTLASDRQRRFEQALPPSEFGGNQRRQRSRKVVKLRCRNWVDLAWKSPNFFARLLHTDLRFTFCRNDVLTSANVERQAGPGGRKYYVTLFCLHIWQIFSIFVAKVCLVTTEIQVPLRICPRKSGCWQPRCSEKSLTAVLWAVVYLYSCKEKHTKQVLFRIAMQVIVLPGGIFNSEHKQNVTDMQNCTSSPCNKTRFQHHNRFAHK